MRRLQSAYSICVVTVLSFILHPHSPAHSATFNKTEIRKHAAALSESLGSIGIAPREARVEQHEKSTAKYDVVLSYDKTRLQLTPEQKFSSNTIVVLSLVFGKAFGWMKSEPSSSALDQLQEVVTSIHGTKILCRASLPAYRNLLREEAEGRITYAELTNRTPDTITCWNGRQKLGTLTQLTKASPPSAEEFARLKKGFAGIVGNLSAQAEEVMYGTEAMTVVKDFFQGLQDVMVFINAFAAQPLLMFDEGWRTKYAAALAAWKCKTERIGALDPPSRFQMTHQDMVRAGGHVDRATELLASGLDHLDGHAFEESAKEIRLATEAMTQATGKLSEQLSGGFPHLDFKGIIPQLSPEQTEEAQSQPFPKDGRSKP